MAEYTKTVNDSISLSESLYTTQDRELGDSISISGEELVIILSDSSESQIEVIPPTDAIEITDVRLRADEFRLVSDSVSLGELLVAVLIPSLTISNMRALTSTKVRIDFDEPVLINDALTDPNSYDFQPITAGAEPIFAQSVVLPPGQSQPLYVEVIVNEMTNDAEYEGAVVGGVVSATGRPIYGAYVLFAGKGESPTVVLVLAVDKNTVEVQFSESMENNAAIFDVGNYSFDGGLVVQSIESLEGSLVTLKTSDQTEGQLYNLVVKGILYSNPIDNVTLEDQLTAQVI